MTAFMKHGKTFISENLDCVQTTQNYCSKVTANLNIQLEHPVFSKTDHRELHNIHEKAAISKTLITDTNAKTERKKMVSLSQNLDS